MRTTSLLVAQWLDRPTGVRKVMGSTPLRDSDIFFVPRPRHVEYSIFSHFFFFTVTRSRQTLREKIQ